MQMYKRLSKYLDQNNTLFPMVFRKKHSTNIATPEYLITTVWFEHKYSTRTKTLYRLPKPRTEAMRRTFFYSTINELNALNLEPTTSFSLMKTTLTNNVASNYTVDNFKVKKLF